MFTYHYKYSHYSKSNNNYNTEIIMFWYNEDDPDVIISCSFDGINIADLDPNENSLKVLHGLAASYCTRQ